jgi:hypothetical protein
MKFMIMHKMTEELEKGLPPTPAIIEGVDRLVSEGLTSGAFVSGEGLKPSRERVHLVYKDGKRTLVDGPFTETKELVGGFALLRVSSKSEAIAWCDRYADVMGNLEIIMGPVVEPWDMGMMDKPDNAPLRFLALQRAYEDENGDDVPPDPQLTVRVRAFIEEMTAQGVLQTTGGLASTKKGARIRKQGHKYSVTDGPFAETKELIAGFAILALPSKQAAIDWGLRFVEVVQVNEVEVRQLNEW